MAFTIQEVFDVAAPVEEVWAFLIDPRQVVVCLPGAEVTEALDERSYQGRVTVKVGPVTARYKGLVRLEETDEGARLVRLTGEGKETGGNGSAAMSMVGRLSEMEKNRTQVDVEAEIEVAGKMARFGRGVMEDVSRQLFREFAENTRKRFAEQERAAAASGSHDTASADPARPHAQSDAGVRPGAPPLRLPGLVFRGALSRIKRYFGG